MNTAEIPQLENICRSCMGEGEDYNIKNKCTKTVSIFNKPEVVENCKITIMELLMLTTPQLNIENDDLLPKILCENCVNRLIKAHEFQEMCIRTELRLRNILNEQKPLIEQDIADPLKDSIKVEGVNDICDAFKSEMNEPLIDHDDFKDLHNGSDDIKDNPTSYDFKDNLTGSEDDFNNDSTCSDDFNYVPTNSDEDCNSDQDIDWTSALNTKKRKKFARKSENASNREKKHDVIENLSTTTCSLNDPEQYEFKCDICGNRLKTRETLRRHKRIHLRGQDNTEAIKNSNNKNSLGDDKSSYQFECDECGSRLKTRKNLGRHKKIHLKALGVEKEKPTNIITQTNECEYCKKVFQKPSLLKDHILVHTGELPFLCSECGKSFRTASVLKQHLLRHGTEKLHVCPDCPKSFSTASDLTSHKAVHAKTKPHVCDVCGAGFVKAFYLKEHKMYHTGEKNHKCDYCDRRFVTGYQCRRHMLTHTGEKPHKCKYCERAYTQSNELMKHLKIHLGDNVYRCSLCPQGFRLHADLREHFNTHRHDDEETKIKNLQALKDEELRLQKKLCLV